MFSRKIGSSKKIDKKDVFKRVSGSFFGKWFFLPAMGIGYRNGYRVLGPLIMEPFPPGTFTKRI
jgi:hypothetical protein